MFVADLLVVPPILGEAAPRDGLKKAVTKLRKSDRWINKGWTRESILNAVDDDFIRHRLHYERMMHGGKDDGGKSFRASTGIKNVKFFANLQECEIVIDGSREWDRKSHSYSTRIKFSNYKLIRQTEGVSWLDKARMLLEDNVRVDCGCDAFRYFYRYKASKNGYAIVRENRPAAVRNPGKRGSVCKHLEHALHYIGGSYSTIASAMKQHHERITESAMTESIDSLVRGSLHENVSSFGIVDVLNGLSVEAGKRGMSRTVNALRMAINEAKVEGAPLGTKPVQPDQRILPVVQDSAQ